MTRIIPAGEHQDYYGPAKVARKAAKQAREASRNRVVICGAGEQGVPLAFYLASKGRAITFIDNNADRGRAAVEKIKELVPGADVHFVEADLFSPGKDVENCFQEARVVVGAATYQVNAKLSLLAVQHGADWVDMGGNPDVVREQFGHAEEAISRGRAIIPNCGLAPGLAEILVREAQPLFASLTSAVMRVGGLPMSDWDRQMLRCLAETDPEKDPALAQMRRTWAAAPNDSFHNVLKYFPPFSVQGLINEYMGLAFEREAGLVWLVEALSRIVPGLAGYCGGRDIYEASPTRGTNFPQVFAYHSQITRLIYETYRYAGHFKIFQDLFQLGIFSEAQSFRLEEGGVIPNEIFKAVMGENAGLLQGETAAAARLLGFLGNERVMLPDLREKTVTPRVLAERLMAANLKAVLDEKDKIIMSVQVTGTTWIGGTRSVGYFYTPFDRGTFGQHFSEMGRLTAFPIGVIVEMLINNEINMVGADGVECFLPVGRMIPKLRQAGINIRTILRDGEGEPVGWQGFDVNDWVQSSF